MQIGRHLQKIGRLESESHSGGVCLSSDKGSRGFHSWLAGRAVTPKQSLQQAGQAWDWDELPPQLGRDELCSSDLLLVVSETPAQACSGWVCSDQGMLSQRDKQHKKWHFHCIPVQEFQRQLSRLQMREIILWENLNWFYFLPSATLTFAFLEFYFPVV